MSKLESKSNSETLNVDFMRSLVKQYSELGQWTSALFWADAAAAAASVGGVSESNGDDIWLLANTMLARGELHRAAHIITTRGFHRKHLLCLGVAARALLAAKDPNAVLALIEECEPGLLEQHPTDLTHNRAVASVQVTMARALTEVERRDAAAETLTMALRADPTCYEALDLLLQRFSLSHIHERQLIEKLPIQTQLAPSEAALVRTAYMHRIQRYQEPQNETSSDIEYIHSITGEGKITQAQRLAGACKWEDALKTLDSVDPWCSPEIRTACLVELRKATELFTFAHTLVDAYPQHWTSWFAVGCYYYLIGKNELARRYLNKAKTFEPSAGCVWLAYGHSFAADNEHDQAMAAYFKASQLMAGCHLPLLYVGVECTLLNNNMAGMFLVQAAKLYPVSQPAEAGLGAGAGWGASRGWAREAARWAADAHVLHEAGVAAFAAADFRAAELLLLRALALADQSGETPSRWAATLDALGHTARKLGRPAAALRWHERALAARPAPAPPSALAAAALAHALARRPARAADLLHAALARAPAHAVALALLPAVMDALDEALTEEEIPQFPFPMLAVTPSPSPAPGPAPATPTGDVTNTSDMSMSFD